MARCTLPAPIAIDKNIRKVTFQWGFSVMTPYHGQPTGIREIAIHVCIQLTRWQTAPCANEHNSRKGKTLEIRLVRTAQKSPSAFPSSAVGRNHQA
jgi:hypothetical protein